VLTVTEGDRVNAETLAEARDYLQIHGIDADYEEGSREEKESVADSILRTTANKGCDLILMGGYGMGPMAEAVLGSTVDGVLRKSMGQDFPLSILICR